MLLKKLTFQNLRSYEEQIIEFPKGSTLLSGDIGSGKTTILLAIEFALFGLQPSQKANSLLKSNQDSARVILEFEIEGRNIIIERTLKKSKKSISQDYSSITINNKKFEESITEIKSRLLKLLNYPKEFAKKTNLLYKFTVYTPQEEMKQIILESEDTRMNTLRHVFGIDKYKRVQENTSLLSSKLREKTRINETLIQNLEQIKEELLKKQGILIELNQKQTQIEKEYNKSVELTKQKEDSLKEVQEKINQKKTLETEKAKSDVLISEKQQQIASYNNNIKNLTIEIQEAKKLVFNQEEYDFLNQRIEFQKNKQENIQKQYIETISKINSLDSKNSEIEQLKNKLSSLKKCPTCLQEVSNQYKNNMLENANKELKLIEKSKIELSKEKTQLTHQIEQTKKTKRDFENKKSEFELLKIKYESLKEKQIQISKIEAQKQNLENDLINLQKNVLTFQESIKDFEKYEIIYEEKIKELNEAKQNENKQAIEKAELNKEIQFTEQLIREKQQEIEKKQELKNQTQKLKELGDWISNKFLEIVLFTEKQVMITLKDEFSKLFSKWFSILVSDSLAASLGDDFSPIIIQQDYELDYSFLSGGERTAIALAYRLSLNQIINSLLSNIKTSNLVILDEPTEGFSSQQLDKMRDVLDQLKVDQLILVSHEPKIEGFVDNIIRVKKEGGISKAGG